MTLACLGHIRAPIEDYAHPNVPAIVATLSRRPDQPIEDLEARDVWASRPELAQGSNATVPPHKLRMTRFKGNATAEVQLAIESLIAAEAAIAV
jgi:hypothetical protein